ncbi:hypothetical protein E3N88_09179 [Mikania micrantha]|uniref:Glycosyltransferase subfamily 4-like N-terminal domain-containing protein n=1 Tax=Mikania micrantha TaxID=192012 RepID=A0A5N6PKL0_9ASTR|nr:hypothetical protein E3N88_09179 [Mikania micrantha]
MALTTTKTKRPICSIQSNLATTLFCVILFTIPALLLLHTPPSSICNTFSSTTAATASFTGDLRLADFSWNHLSFSSRIPPPVVLKIAVFTRKWPVGTTPGGMERHAYTLYTTLATRGHEIHIFTSPPHEDVSSLINTKTTNTPIVHFHEDAQPGQWRYNKAWEQYEDENQKRPFDVIHTESVALPHYKARNIPNLAVSWHGIALESVTSSIYQDLLRRPHEQISQSFNTSLQLMIPKVLNEIRFFRNYQHHIAISDSCGEMLRDVYQIPTMMAGKPVMASRFPSIKGTILVDDEYGFMFSPNVESLVEALEAVVAEGPVRLARRGKACRRFASSMFTARKMALAYERLFLCIKNETMLWFTPTFLGPKRSDVIDTAAEKKKPELRPMREVPIWSASLVPVSERTRNAIAVGASPPASHPVLAKYIFLYTCRNQIAI